VEEIEMLARAFSDRGVMMRAFGYLSAVAAFGAVCASVPACSGFSGDSCAATRTCSHKGGAGGETPETDAAPSGVGGSTGNGGQPGTGGNGALPGASGSGGVGGSQSPVAAGGVDSGAPAAGSSAAGATGIDAGAGSSPATDGGADRGATCRAGFADCNRDPADGCEVELATDTQHCGTCETSCSAAGASMNACVAGKCAPTCDTTHADCDKSGINGCEVDITTPQNCGSCGHACSGQNTTKLACTDGACEPACAAHYGDCKTPAAPAADDGCETNLTAQTSCGTCGHDCQGGKCDGSGQCEPKVLANGIVYPYRVVVDGKYAFWLDQPNGATGRRLMRVPVDGGGATQVSVESAGTGLAVDGTNVYFGSASDSVPPDAPNGDLYWTPRDAGTSNAFGIPTDVTAIAADGKSVYWADASNNQISKIKRDGSGGAVAVASGLQQVSTLIVDGTTLFGISEGLRDLFSVFVGGGGVTRVTTLDAGALSVTSSAIAVDSTRAYTWFMDAKSVFHLEQLEKTTFVPVRELATSSSVVSAYTPLAYASNYVYFVQNDGIYRVSTAGGAKPTLVVKTNALALAMTVYGGALYWAENGTSIASSLKKLAVF
jgi:hypothetical protein